MRRLVLSKEVDNKFAVIQTGGNQYNIKEGSIFDIEKIDAEVGAILDFKEVLLVRDAKLFLGKPFVEGACVKAEVLEQHRDEKKIVFKFKNKTGYKLKKGYKQRLTRVRVKEIVLEGNHGS